MLALSSLSLSSVIITSCLRLLLGLAFLIFSCNWSWYTASDQLTICFVRPAAHPSFSDSWPGSLLNQSWLEEIMNHSLHRDWEIISHAGLPVCTVPSCPFLSAGWKFSRRYMTWVSEWVRKLLYKRCSVNFVFAFCCVCREKSLISQCQLNHPWRVSSWPWRFYL